MTLDASGFSLSDAAAPGGGGAFSITLKAGGRGPSEASERGDGTALEPSGWVEAAPGAVWGWGKARGGRRTVVGGELEAEDLLLTAGEGRVVAAGDVVNRGGLAPGRAG